MDIHRGAVFWVDASGDAGDAPSGIAHPHVVIQDDLFNQSRIATVIVCPLPSNLQRTKEPGSVLLDPGEAGLAKQSVVLAARLASIPKTNLGAYIGTLAEARVEQVLSALRFLQAMYFHGR